MFFIGKKTMAAALVMLLVFGAVAAGAAAVFMPAESTGVSVVVDAGHGGWDGGVTASDGTKESEINLELALELADKLERRGVAVVLTRKDDNALADGKRADMEKRAEIIAASNAVCVISLHLNSFPAQKSRRGVQVFYDDTGKGGSLAAALQAILNARINARYCGRTDLAPQAGDFFITKCSSLPSAIVECGFLSNAEDKALLQSKKFRSELCEALADAIYEIAVI